MELDAGGNGTIAVAQLVQCPGQPSGLPSTTLTCAFTLSASAAASLAYNGTLAVTAKATDRSGHVTTKMVTVTVSSFSCLFVNPSPSPGTNPPIANLASISPLSIEVSASAPLPMKTVVVTADNGQIVASYPTMPPPGNLTESTRNSFSAEVNWSTAVGYGMHKLRVVCTDTAGNSNSDTLLVNVGCGSDQDCPAGDRCCSQDGKCYETVAEGADCDCQHPCPDNQGCLPGVCDASPMKCRPGCFPGSSSPPPYGTAPSSCASQEGLLAFCSPLPADQITPNNMGGACAVGDNCDTMTQNCPDLPLDRSQPATMPKCTTQSSACPNPTVPQDCIPLAPGVNGCFPAGPIAAGGTGCNQACGTVAGNCAKGSWCTQATDANGNPLGPPTCAPQCPTPMENPTSFAGCPVGQSCNQVFAPEMQPYPTGVCQ